MTSVEDRLHQMEERLEQLEEKGDQRWQSYKRLLNGILRSLGGDVEGKAEGR